ncbi:hypothetical protein [Rhodoferax sp.]|jgi:hypothetical protein|uniref:hypothetical protein n=1 Tax=Rhodoferax sp. TaxID=50421 RepID=UPI0025FAE4F8|nr:hypothetical protein [Rhodoferax sp.]
MYIVPIGWLYVALMMAVAEATNTNGTVLGGIFTFLLYGLGPVSLVVYLMGAPGRRKALKKREAAEQALGLQPDAGSHAPTDPAAPVREEA